MVPRAASAPASPNAAGFEARAPRYLYAPTNASDDALVGAYVPPENLTVAAVTSAAGSFAELPAAIITKCVELLAERALYDSKPWDHIWRDAIYQTFLKPTGANSTIQQKSIP